MEASVPGGQGGGGSGRDGVTLRDHSASLGTSAQACSQQPRIRSQTRCFPPKATWEEHECTLASSSWMKSSHLPAALGKV